VLSGAGLEMNLGTREVKRGDRSLDLTKTEFDLLESLMRDPGKVVSRNQLYEEVWGIDFETSSNSLDVYVGYIRRKTEAGDQARVIHTVRGVGYVLREDR
jgi:two-component system response regulator MprA